jgi:GNAT superfamily N-acetyltransferase
LVRAGLTVPGSCEVRVRRRFLDSYRAECTTVVTVDALDVGLIAVRPETDGQWIEHFFLQPALQGRGLGTAVLRCTMLEHRDERPFLLNVLRGSAARRLYERHGFVHDSEDDVDEWLIEARVGG